MGVWQGKASLATSFVCLMLAPFGLLDLEGVLTGARIFACIISLKTNKKARTKPLLVYGIM